MKNTDIWVYVPGFCGIDIAPVEVQGYKISNYEQQFREIPYFISAN
jgi:hypothetical protein